MGEGAGQYFCDCGWSGREEAKVGLLMLIGVSVSFGFGSVGGSGAIREAGGGVDVVGK